MGDLKDTGFGNLLKEELIGHRTAYNLEFNEKITKLISKGEKVYHFGFGQSPFLPPDVMVQALKEHASENAYLNVAGIEELRSAIVNLHARHDNTKFDKDHVVVGPGSKELIYLLLNVFKGDVLIANPTWPTYKPQTQLAGHKPYVVPTRHEEEWRITPEALEQVILTNNLSLTPKILIFCNPDNPTGTDYQEQHLRELGAACRKHRIVVISDEIYARLHYEANHQTLCNFYPEGTILSSGFSKWSSAGGWRVGYHIYPPELKQLRDAVSSAASHTYSCAPAPMQYAIAKALANEKECDDYIKHTTRIMKAVGEYCYRELTAIGMKCVRPKAGYYCFPNFEICREAFAKRGITKGTQMCEAMLNECHVALLAGGPAFLRPLDEFTVRFCFVNFDGEYALTESKRIGLTEGLPTNFVQTHATKVHLGVQELKKWITKQLNTDI